NATQPVLILADPASLTVIHATTGEVLSEHTIDPTKGYWRNTNKAPGRWPEALKNVNDDPTHL
ncbi:hypothetical protein M3G03_12810, partial [Aestuariimicrobium sp. p3-SID1156]|nr:hypothetical protein [Aestuariimicrobium sp. p3-SID1156]